MLRTSNRIELCRTFGLSDAFLVTALVFGMLLGGGICWGQVSPKRESIPEYVPQTEDFKSANAALRDHLKSMRHLIGF